MCFGVVVMYNTAKVVKNLECDYELTYFNNFLHEIHATGGSMSISVIHGPMM